MNTCILWVALGVAFAGCNLEKGKCLERCKVDGRTASAGCETSDDPVTCKQKAAAAEEQCTKKCNE